MSAKRGADGSPETTERLLQESRKLLRDLGERLGGEDGAVVPDAEPGEEPA